MEGLAGLAAVLVGGGSVLVATATDRRFAVLGATAALLAAPLIGSSWPDPLPLAFREVAVMTGAYILWIAARRGEPRVPHEERAFIAVFVVVGFVGGAAVASALGTDRISVAAFASTCAAAVSAVALGIAPPHGLARGLSAIMVTLAAVLGVVGLSGASGPFEHAVIGATLLAVSVAAALLGSRLR